MHRSRRVAAVVMGMTRFAAFFHCNDGDMVGPIRSARDTDPSIIEPITSILVAAGANEIVAGDLEAAGVITIDETSAGMTDGEQLAVDNVLVEMRTVYLSTDLGDSQGAPSPYFEDVPSRDRALLFRNGRVIVGTWQRHSEDGKTSFRTRSGDEMNLRPGATVIEMVPNEDGDVAGSVSFRA